MARKTRVEVDGGLYHVIARGNDRQDIFHSKADHQKFLTILAQQKAACGFLLYAYCLMTNHVHLLIERQAESIGRVMQRLLTGYSQHYNRKYRRVGHVFQGRHKAILCQSEVYLAKLVRYIHLNPVRARMVGAPAEYPHSSHRSYMSLESASIVDVDPVLRHFGNRRETAIHNFALFMGEDDEEVASYSSAEGDVLGSEGFVDANIHRLGDIGGRRIHSPKVERPPFDAAAMVSAVEAAFGLRQDQFCGPDKNARMVLAKEVLIIASCEAGATLADLTLVVGLDSSSISRRHDAANRKLATDPKLAYAKKMVEKKYHERIAESQV